MVSRPLFVSYRETFVDAQGRENVVGRIKILGPLDGSEDITDSSSRFSFNLITRNRNGKENRGYFRPLNVPGFRAISGRVMCRVFRRALAITLGRLGQIIG